MSVAQDTELVDLISSFLGSPQSPHVDAPYLRASSLFQSSNTKSASTKVLQYDSLNTQHDRIVPIVRVVVFSKDRPWQLKQLLISMKLPSLLEPSHRQGSSLINCHIFIIVHFSSHLFAKGYNHVIQSFQRYQSSNTGWKLQFIVEEKWANSFVISAKSQVDGGKGGNPFSQILEYVLTCDVPKRIDAFNPSSQNNEKNQEFVMFLTDDCLLLEPLETILASAVGALTFENPCFKIFNFISRLHLGITWSQTCDTASPPPRCGIGFYSSISCKSELDECNSFEDFYLYERESCTVEWNYPFDLSGGIYHHYDILSLLKNIRYDGGLLHPNIFESRCNKELMNKYKSNEPNKLEPIKTLSAIPTRPYLVIIAVNRVQNVFSAPLASSTWVKISKDDYEIDPSSPLDLLKLLDTKHCFDILRYKNTLYNVSHIGDFFLYCDTDGLNESTICQRVSREGQEMRITLPQHGSLLLENAFFLDPKLSVLIPVHCGPPEAGSHAILSILMEPIFEIEMLHKNHKAKELLDLNLLPMQIVLVDDRCTDGSIEAMIAASKKLCSRHKISLKIQDHRDQNQTLHSSISSLTYDSNTVIIEIVSAPQPGVAPALNYGMAHCRSDLIARMDADDVSTSKRLLTQIQFMHANPSFSVVGTSAVLFTTEKKDVTDDNNYAILPYQSTCLDIGLSCVEQCELLRTSLTVSDPGFMSWAMLFSCSISHPTIMFRKSVIQRLLGYSDASLSCEDYDLWLRLTQSDCRSMTSLPFLGLWHRKHSQSNSSLNSATQKKESDLACYKTLEGLICTKDKNDVLTLNYLSTLRHPDSAENPTSVDGATRLLACMERSFIELHYACLTRQEISLIKNDVNARISELGTIMVEKFGNNCNSFTWKFWCERCPDQQLERLSVLCHSNRAFQKSNGD